MLLKQTKIPINNLFAGVESGSSFGDVYVRPNEMHPKFVQLKQNIQAFANRLSKTLEKHLVSCMNINI